MYNKEKHTEAIIKPGCHEVDFTGKSLKGIVFVDPEGIDMDKDLADCIDMAIEYYPIAKSSKYKKNKE